MRQEVCREKVVGQALGELGHRVGRGRRDDEQVRPVRQEDVIDGGRLSGAPHLGPDLGPRQNGKRERLNELPGPSRHGDANLGASLLQTPQNLDGLVGGDSARDAEEDAGRLAAHGNRP